MTEVILKKRGRSILTVPRMKETPKTTASRIPAIPPMNESRESVVSFTAPRKRTVSTPSRSTRTKVSTRSPAATVPCLRAAIDSTFASISRFRPLAVFIIHTTMVVTKTAPAIMSGPS